MFLQIGFWVRSVDHVLFPCYLLKYTVPRKQCASSFSSIALAFLVNVVIVHCTSICMHLIYVVLSVCLSNNVSVCDFMDMGVGVTVWKMMMMLMIRV